MLHTTEGIVLRTLRHQDSNLIVRLYTQKFGIQDFILKGYGSAQGRKKYSNFQPMSILEIVYNEKPGSSLHSIQESRASVFFAICANRGDSPFFGADDCRDFCELCAVR